MKKTVMISIAAAMTICMCACGAVFKDTSEDSSVAASKSVDESTQTTETAKAESQVRSDSEIIDEIVNAIEGSAAEEESTSVTEENTGSETEDDHYSGETLTSEANVTSNGAIDASDLFSDRDLRQTADTDAASFLTLSDGQDITITEEGVYVISGTASEVTVIVDAPDEAKVQLVLDGVSVSNSDSPFIYVKNADKVFVTTTETENSISVNGTFTADGETNTDAAIYSKDDLVINGTGSLSVYSTDNGISCKDDLKITGGTLVIECASDALEANESVSISGGDITIVSDKDGIHAENEEDNTTGSVYICGGSLNIRAADDGIHATTIAQIDDGTISITGAEGIEATWVQINGGAVYISASDDGINGAYKSGSYTPTIEINGGTTVIVMGSGDTDGVDCNGNIYINGGTIDVTGQSAFDYDGTAEYNGGTIIVNGEETTTITNQFGGMGGGMGGPNGSEGPKGSWGGQSGNFNSPGSW